MLSILKLYRALRYSFDGLAATFRNERAFRQEVVLVIILAPIGLWLAKSGVERALLLGSLLLVLIVELINTAVETLVDRISSERHLLSGRAKDIGSASVLIALLNVVLVWGFVLLG